MGRYVFKLPDVGEGTAEAELVGWHVKIGDTVAEDQIVADVMTDKATVELTSPVSGVVAALHGEPGLMVAVRGPLIEFEVEGEGNAAAETMDSSPFPLEGGRAGDGGEATSSPMTPQDSDGVSATDFTHQASTPTQPSPLEGEGSQANYVFKLPDVGEGTAEAELVGWKVAVGDVVEEDQLLAEVMTDKATVELTSPVAGTVLALHGQPGQSSPVGGPLVSFQVEGAGNVTPASSQSAPFPLDGGRAGDGGEGSGRMKTVSETPLSGSSASSSVATAVTPNPTLPPSRGKGLSVPALTGRAAGERPLASPAVRNRARDLGVDLTFVSGSGPAGRIGHDDLDAWIARGGAPSQGSAPVATGGLYAPAEGTTEVRIIGLRRKIAEKMAESVRRIPHITYVEEIDMTALEELRAHLNATRKKDQPKLNVLPFIARAIVVALRDQPQINATYDDENGVLTQHNAVHLGIAAQTPNGLMVPVVRHAEARDPYDTAAEIARVSGAAKDGSARREELSGSTITITSLGTLGGVVHTPIINHPEVAIVGPNKIEERVVVRGGQMVVRKMMNLSSSFDHRIVDGHDAAVFVQRIKGLLEHPATLWM